MNLVYNISYKSSVAGDLKNIDKNQAGRILQELEEVFSKDTNPGTPLKGQFKGLFKYSIGDYRVIYTKTTDGVLVLRIAHRSKAYQ